MIALAVLSVVLVAGSADDIHRTSTPASPPLSVTLLAAGRVEGSAALPSRSPVVVVVASKRAGSEVIAAKISTQVHTALIDAGLTDALDDRASQPLMKKAKVEARSCMGATSCLIKVAFSLSANAVVIGVDVTPGSGASDVRLVAVAADTVGALEVADLTVPFDSTPDAFADFARAVVNKLRPAAPPEVVRIPERVEVVETPAPAIVAPPIAPNLVVRRDRTAGRRAMPWVAAAFGIVALAASSTFAVLGAGDRNTIDTSLFTDRGALGSTLSRADFDATVSRGNTRFTISLVTAVIGVVLVATSVLLFSTGD